MPKRLRFLVSAIAIAIWLPGLLWPKAEFFRIENLRPGMRGIGRTCYQGTRPEEFQVEILGVLHGVNPGTSAVLARLSGGMIEKTGVFEGMSGSPVYIEGKLLGAVAYSFPFAREPICGISPITQIIDSFEESQNLPGTKVLFQKSAIENDGRVLSGAPSGLKAALITAEDIKRQPALVNLGGHSLVPIATPLSIGGFDAEVIKVFAPRLKTLGLSVLQGSGGMGEGSRAVSSPDSEDSPLEPGSNIVISLVRGDLDVSA